MSRVHFFSPKVPDLGIDSKDLEHVQERVRTNAPTGVEHHRLKLAEQSCEAAEEGVHSRVHMQPVPYPFSPRGIWSIHFLFFCPSNYFWVVL